MRRQFTQRILGPALTIALAGSSALASTYYNGDVSTSYFNQSGHTYILDDAGSYALSLTNFGRTNGDSDLQILSGSDVTSTGDLAMGYSGTTAINNAITVDGAGSTLSVTSTGLSYIGTNEGYQSVTIQNGASASFAGSLAVARRNDAHGNTLTVDNATLAILTGTSGNLHLQRNSNTPTNNHIVVTNGGLFMADNATYSVTANIGLAGGTDNTLDLVNGGAFVLANGSSSFTVNSGAFVRLNGGLLAWIGDQTTTLADSAFQVWEDDAWVAGVKDSNYTATFYADESAASAAGLAGYGGYTVITNVVPEPASLALLGLGALFIAGRGRKHAD